jgi:hypothetical protein
MHNNQHADIGYSDSDYELLSKWEGVKIIKVEFRLKNQVGIRNRRQSKLEIRKILEKCRELRKIEVYE